MGKASRIKARDRVKVGPHARVPRITERPLPGTPRVKVFGSDIKQSEPVAGICGLCHENTRLSLSHTTPKWAYKWMKAEGGVLRGRVNSQARTSAQDGSKHYLLCATCEQYLGDAENYLRLATTGSRAEQHAQNMLFGKLKKLTFCMLEGNPNLLCRALCGIVLKEHYAPTTSCRIPSNNLVEKVRVAILNDNYESMGLVCAIKWMGVEDMNPRAYAGSGVRKIVDGSISAQVSIAGFDWWILISGRSRRIEEDFGGPPVPWTIWVSDVRQRAVWFDNWEEWKMPIGDPWAEVPLDGPCPCGLPNSFDECCRSTWCAV